MGIGVGKCKIGNLYLENVIYAPGMEVSVISTRQLTRSGYSLLHRDDLGLVLDQNGDTLLTTKYEDNEGLYIVPGNTHNASKTRAAITNARKSNKSTAEFIKWHRRLGHINPARMRAMANR